VQLKVRAVVAIILWCDVSASDSVIARKRDLGVQQNRPCCDFELKTTNER
jgi:hypothetical protein